MMLLISTAYPVKRGVSVKPKNANTKQNKLLEIPVACIRCLRPTTSKFKVGEVFVCAAHVVEEVASQGSIVVTAL